MIFYVPDINGDKCVLDEDESAHAVKVLRLKKNDKVTLTDGKGGNYDAVITHPHAGRCEALVTGRRQQVPQRRYYLHIAIAPTKNIDRFEWFVEKSAEIGIDEITPVLCEHSERKNVRAERAQRIATAAMKQSGQAYLARINTMLPFADWLAGCTGDKKLIAYCGDVEKSALRNVYEPGKSVAVAIGPEGDFSREEVQRALAAGFDCITLGESRLRTETAGIVACHAVCFMNGA
ncbi:MAG: 16S rRNA (uracil(1498)-N(3))-methyltransferase [Bacteroidales bacterium]|jgi:16S rRNA (uracil1498-N3)-methyltransferase|nr:16S rRNA (uracil(1498)-N(3))-methyltransferase [Bacteroidales bacterium]